MAIKGYNSYGERGLAELTLKNYDRLITADLTSRQQTITDPKQLRVPVIERLLVGWRRSGPRAQYRVKAVCVANFPQFLVESDALDDNPRISFCA